MFGRHTAHDVLIRLGRIFKGKQMNNTMTITQCKEGESDMKVYLLRAKFQTVCKAFRGFRS